MLLKLGKRRLVTDVFKDVAVAITFAANGKGGVSCCCSAQERCLDQGCSFQPYIDEAMQLVLKASEMRVGEVLYVLDVSVRRASSVPGTAVRYGSGLCVVLMGQGSWPYAVVRKTVFKKWVCLACPTSDASCGHRSAAAHAADHRQNGGANSEEDGDSALRYPDDPDGEPPPAFQFLRAAVAVLRGAPFAASAGSCATRHRPGDEVEACCSSTLD